MNWVEMKRWIYVPRTTTTISKVNIIVAIWCFTTNVGAKGTRADNKLTISEASPSCALCDTVNPSLPLLNGVLLFGNRMDRSIFSSARQLELSPSSHLIFNHSSPTSPGASLPSSSPFFQSALLTCIHNSNTRFACAPYNSLAAACWKLRQKWGGPKK